MFFVIFFREQGKWIEGVLRDFEYRGFSKEIGGI